MSSDATRSAVFDLASAAIRSGQYHVSEHAYDEAVQDGISILSAVMGLPMGEVLEDYPEDLRGPSCLTLCQAAGKPVHLVVGYDKGAKRAIIITVYRPDPARWSDDFRRRRDKHGK